MREDYNYSQDRGYANRSTGRNQDNPPNFGSARSDYGQRAYGGRLNAEGIDRGWLDRTADEVSSWFGDEEAERRRRMDENRERGRERASRRREFMDRGPRDYQAEGSRYSNMSAPEYINRDRGNWRELRAGDAMTTRVATVYADDPVEHAARIMGECDCGAIPVVDWQHRMIGMITDRDITIRLVGNGVDTMDARVGDCMTKDVFACHVKDGLQNCMRTMSHHKIRRVPVVDDRNRVVGIISQADIAQHAAENAGMGERRALSDVICAVTEPTSSSYV
ncbi:MAG TPA: CBS domain-containing protein [Pyrinomonadaceae bacterium]|nr:CBS domain-containing protein [Pyrinomonadaceae bacterium]